LNSDIRPDPWDQFDDAASLIAFVNRKGGLEAVKELLVLAYSQPVPEKPWLAPAAELVACTTRERLEELADKLKKLPKVAELVRAHAVTRPLEASMCPYPPGSTNARAWHASKYRRAYKAS